MVLGDGGAYRLRLTTTTAVLPVTGEFEVKLFRCLAESSVVRVAKRVVAKRYH